MGDKWQDWEAHGFSNRSANIASALSRHPAVDSLLVINNPTSYAKALAKYATGRLSTRSVKWRSIYGYFLDEVSPKTTVVEQIRLFPRERSNSVTFMLNGLLYDNELIQFIKEAVGRNPQSPLVVWLNSPVFAKFAGRLGEDLLVYDAQDDWLYHPQLRPIKSFLANGCHLISERVDLVFAVSQVLGQRFKGGRPQVLLMPNGIDKRLFGHPCDDVPGDLADLPKPIIGYVGVMQQRFDVDFMAEVAARMPHASFVLVGPVFTPHHFKPLKKMPNVHFLGPKHQSLIPGYISHFDVSMMPHVDDDLTSAMNPIKLYEYLAMGKPAICTKVQGLEQFGGFVDIATDPKSFVELINRSLREPDVKKQKRVDFARGQSWQQRVDYMIKAIERKLEDKASFSSETLGYPTTGNTIDIRSS